MFSIFTYISQLDTAVAAMIFDILVGESPIPGNGMHNHVIVMFHMLVSYRRVTLFGDRYR